MRTSTETPKEPVSTVVTEQILVKLNICKESNILTLICGGTGRGKSMTAEYFCHTTPGAVYIKLRSSATPARLVGILAEALLGTARQSMEQNKKAIRDFLTENQRMIVIDEANQLLASKNMSTRIANMEYIRLDIYEHTRTPVAMIFTKYSIQDFKEGDMASFLEQFLGRGINTLDIPARMFGESEVYPILRHYVPDASVPLRKLALEIARGTGKLRSFVKYLEIAQRYVEEHPGTQISEKLLRTLQQRSEGIVKWPED